jgi:hypothetical protein
MTKLKKAAFAAAAALILQGAAPPAAPSAEAQANAEDIVVTARRSGIPVWHVRSDTTSVILVGVIEGVTKDTKWDPASLEAAIRKSDRVMFPNMVAVSVSPFKMIGYLMKWRGQSKMDKGRSLQQMLAPADFARLTALQGKGALDKGFERKHPLHLSMTLRGRARRGLGDGVDPNSFVRKVARKHKVEVVPIASLKGKPLAQDLFNSPAQRHIPCLLASIDVAEAGPEAVRAYSHAWAQRRVAEVLRSPVERPGLTCWPADLPLEAASRPHLKAGVRKLLADPRVTLAVFSLRALAEPNGILDDLDAAGFDIQGPAWKGQ